MPLIVKQVKPHAKGCKGKLKMTGWGSYDDIQGWTYGHAWICTKHTCPAEVLVREDSITAAVEAALRGKK